jgi:hypothetical protein
MQLVDKNILIRYRQKNIGNVKLSREIERLITDIESSDIRSPKDLLEIRKDADRVHSAEIYFLNLHFHRVLLMMEFQKNWAIVLWIGTHSKYVAIFKNNKDTIEKWLRTNKIL